MADQVDALGREIPYLILQKAPQLTLQKLRDKYPDGGEMGWYAFVQEYRTFVYWDVDEGQWKPTGNEEVRHLAEQERLAEELLRKEEEGTRYGAEIQRNNAEGIRISNEKGRVTAEGFRMSDHSTAMQEAGEATEAANDAANDATTALRSANYLGAIAHDAAAPTPTSNGFYHFSNGGAVSWLPGAPTVSTGDRVVVIFNDPNYTYTYLPQEDRVLTVPQALSKEQRDQVKLNIDVEGANLWEVLNVPPTVAIPDSFSWNENESLGTYFIENSPFVYDQELKIVFGGQHIDIVASGITDEDKLEFFIDDATQAQILEDNIAETTISTLETYLPNYLTIKDSTKSLQISIVDGLQDKLNEIEIEADNKIEKPTEVLVLKKLDLVWQDGFVKISTASATNTKKIEITYMAIKTGQGVTHLKPIVNHPSRLTYDGYIFQGFLLKDIDNILSENLDFDTLEIRYSLLAGVITKYDGTAFSLGKNVIFNDVSVSHYNASIQAFDAVYPEFTGTKNDTVSDPLTNNTRINSIYKSAYCKIKDASIISEPFFNWAQVSQNGSNPNILSVVGHYGNTFERHDITPNANTFLQNVIAIGAAPATGTPNEDWTSYGFGLEFSEPGNNIGLNAAYPDVLFTRDVGSATISADKKVLTTTHPSWRFTNIIDLEVGGEIGIGSDNFIILEKRTIASIDSPTQLTVTEPFTASPAPLTLYIDNAKIGTVWQPNGEDTKFYQSPVCAIVMAKFRKIKDLSGANWHICRMAARATASQAGAWDMYRGFGVIDVDAAVQWIEDNYKSEEHQEMLADQLEGLRGISPFISEEKLKANSPVPKRIVDDLLLEKVNIIPGHLLIPVEELAKVQRIDFTVNKSEPLDEDSIGIWDSEEEKFVGTKISDFKEFLTNTFEASVSKSTTLDPESDEDIPTSKAVATYIAGGLFGQIVEFRIENDMHMYYITKAPYANVDLGQVGFVHRGAYDPLYPYRKLDLVTTADSSYLYIANSVGIGKAVLNTAYWACIADGKPATQAANAANQAAILANTKAGLANQATQDANDAADNANNAVDTLLSNVISLELRTDMHLYLTTPDVYDGFTFKISNGRLIAMT